MMSYAVLKRLMRVALYCYFREIRFSNADRLQPGRPVMVLPNHQNALLDPLLLAAFLKGTRPYFLTRSDVFRGLFLKAVFAGLRMLPVYRMRDGRETLGRNQAIFDRCASLLHQGEALLLFPEANHNLRRQVRPLSKGFTRIVAQTLDSYPGTDLHLLPMGVNYQQAAGFPDRAAFLFGEPFPAAPFLKTADRAAGIRAMTAAVSKALKGLTTHLPEGVPYGEQLAALEALQPDYLQPGPINRHLAGESARVPRYGKRKGGLFACWDGIFRLLNFPVLLLWRIWIAPRVPEPEFRGTYRFAYSLVAFPAYFLLLGLALYFLAGARAALLCLPALFLHNLLYVKKR